MGMDGSIHIEVGKVVIIITEFSHVNSIATYNNSVMSTES